MFFAGGNSMTRAPFLSVEEPRSQYWRATLASARGLAKATSSEAFIVTGR